MRLNKLDTTKILRNIALGLLVIAIIANFYVVIEMIRDYNKSQAYLKDVKAKYEQSLKKTPDEIELDKIIEENDALITKIQIIKAKENNKMFKEYIKRHEQELKSDTTN